MKDNIRIFIALLLSISMFSSFKPLMAEVTGSFNIPQSAGDPDEDPTKDRVEALYKQIGVGGGGVNLFTGDASLSIPIDILSLNYSGNVYKILASPNQRIQSSWVGVGWSLTMGHISAVQNNTVGLTDDKYYIVTEDGVSGELKQIGGTGNKFCLEDYKYWIIKRFLDANDKITHWQVTREDGTIYVYGDNAVSSSSVYQGNRYAICWNNNWIGNGTSTANTSQIPYQWDLTAIKDVFGNEVLTIEYQHPDNPEFSTNLYYTRSSYLESITDRTGKRIEFVLEKRDSSEWVDPYPDYDNLTERYETKRLGSINIKSPEDDTISIYNFISTVVEAGEKIDASTTEGRGKRFLLSITQTDKNDNELPSYKFDYADLEDPDGDGNYDAMDTLAYRGSIKKVTYPSGGSTTFKYSYEATTEEITTTNGIKLNALDGINYSPIFMEDACDVFMTDEHFVVLNSFSGGPYGPTEYLLEAWHNDGVNWDRQGTVPYNGFNILYGPIHGYQCCYGDAHGGQCGPTHHIIGPVLKGFGDHLAMITPTIDEFNQDRQLLTWEWNGKKWQDPITVTTLSDVNIDSFPELYIEPILILENEKLIIFENYNDTIPLLGHIITGNWIVDHWEITDTLKNNIIIRRYINRSSGKKAVFKPIIQVAGNHLISVEPTQNCEKWRLNAWEWDGTDWNITVEDQDNILFCGYTCDVEFKENQPNVQLTNDKLVIVDHDNSSGESHIKAYNWNGNDWNEVTIANAPTMTWGFNHQFRVVDDKLIVLEETGELYETYTAKSVLHAWHWNGEQYAADAVNDQTIPVTWGLNFQHAHLGVLADKIVILQPDNLESDINLKASLRSWQYDKENHVWDGYAYGEDENGNSYNKKSFIKRDIVWYKYASIPVKFDLQSGSTSDVIVNLSAITDEEDDDIDFRDLRAWRWNGMKWEERLFLDDSYGHNPAILGGKDRLFILEGHYKANNNYSDAAYQSVWAFQDYNETWGGLDGDPINDVRVISKTTNDMMGTKDTTSIDYENGVYDTEMGSAKYNKVVVRMPDDNGSTETYFYNDLEIDSLIDFQPVDSDTSGDEGHYKELDGKPYKIVNKDNGGTEVSSAVNTYFLYDIDSENNVFHSRLVKTENTIDGINITESYQYNDENGMVKTKTETNTDGTERITETTYAFELLPYYDPQTQKLIFFYDNNSDYHNDMGSEDKHQLSQVAQTTVYENAMNENNAKSSMVTTYKDWGNGYLLERQFVWAENDPNASLPAFNSWNSNLNPDSGDWIKTGEVKERDQYGNLLESITPNGTVSSTIYGYNQTLPIATVSNANDAEFGYTSFENDESNGWGDAQIITNNDAHTGEKVARVNTTSYLLMQYFRESDGLNTDTGFEASVWGKGPSTAYITMKVNNGANGAPCVYDYCSGTGEWELLTVKVTKDQVLANMDDMDDADFICVYVANSSFTDAYFDDLCFYPEDALMSSQTFDSGFLKVSSQSDQNNIPTYYGYDSFGRLETLWNVNNVTLNGYEYYYSADHNGGAFNPLDPNYVKTITLPGYPNQIETVSYVDGLGRQIQTRIENGASDIVDQTIYNDMGQVWKQYKPQKVTSTSNFYNMDGSSFPYETMTYQTDPLLRPDQVIHADGNAITYDYAIENIGATPHRLEQVTDEKGIISKQYINKFDQIVQTYSGDPAGINITWTQDSDVLGNVTDTQPPNYHNPPRGVANDWDINVTYNTLGQVVGKKDPDMAQTIGAENYSVRYFYDVMGNVRFSQDAEQYANNVFTAYTYDKLNRITRIGEEKSTTWATACASPTAEYGSATNEWKVKQFYDVNYTTEPVNYTRGQLAYTEINEDTDSNAEHTIAYVYDKFGNMTRKEMDYDLAIAGAVGKQSLEFEYDALGREVSSLYPSGNLMLKQYDEVGNLENILAPATDVPLVLVKTKIFLEGPYTVYGYMTTDLNTAGVIPLTSPYEEDPRTVTSIPANVTDWVLVELRRLPDAPAVVSKSAFLHKDGRVLADNGSTHEIELIARPGDYYIVIRHRNHLAAMSANPVTLSENSCTLYDFTTSIDMFYKKYASQLVAKNLYGVVWGMWSGDGNHSEGCYAEDYTLYQITQGDQGYLPADYNLSSGVYAEDYTIYQLNQGLQSAIAY